MPTYVLTGANRGLGLEFVRQLSQHADNIVIAGVRTLAPPPRDLIDLQTSAKGKVYILKIDTSSESSIHDFATAVTETLGSPTAIIDYVLNNAGINDTPCATSLDFTGAELERHMAVNVLGPARIVAELSAHLQQGSVVMNMTSRLASLTHTSQGEAMGKAKCAVYAISKAALNMLTLHQASDLKMAGVIVIALSPGWVKTDMGGEGAIMEPEESVSNILKTLGGWDASKSGKFLWHNGQEQAW